VAAEEGRATVAPAASRAGEPPAKPRIAAARPHAVHRQVAAHDRDDCRGGCATAPSLAGNPPTPSTALPITPTAQPVAARQATAFGVPLPRVPVPGVVVRSAETVVGGAHAVTGWVAGLLPTP
jgi:hypothetical protein